jgi:predicted GIY-YIG superfamily endonuclease
MKTRKPRGYWTFDVCLEEAQKFESKSDWALKSSASLDAAKTNGWFEICTMHMKRPISHRLKWTKDNCMVEALKYDSKSNWKLNAGGSFNSAKKNGWINDCTKHMIRLGSKYKRLIYAFEFSDKCVYIGLTYNPKERREEHLNSKRKKKSAVYQHIVKTGLYPEYKELTEYIDKDSASVREGEYLNKYKQDGWIILNKIKTGGLGGNIRIWSKEVCESLAKNYNTKIEFLTNHRTPYLTSQKRGWLNEICSHMKPLRKIKI